MILTKVKPGQSISRPPRGRSRDTAATRDTHSDPAIDAEVDLSIADSAHFLRARLNVSLPSLEREVAQAAWAHLGGRPAGRGGGDRLRGERADGALVASAL